MTLRLDEIGKQWRRAADRERQLRTDRDVAIREAHGAGVGVREIARQVGIDPTQVMRVVRR